MLNIALFGCWRPLTLLRGIWDSVARPGECPKERPKERPARPQKGGRANARTNSPQNKTLIFHEFFTLKKKNANF